MKTARYPMVPLARASAFSLWLAFAAMPGSAGIASPEGAAPQSQPRIYFIGNSVTDAIRYPAFAEIAAARGIGILWGRTMIPGAPLDWIYTHPNDGFQEQPYGTWIDALNRFPWDIVSLQPFDRHLHNTNDAGEDSGDVPMILKFSELAAKQNPDVQIYIYARWPRITSGGKAMEFDKNDFDPAMPGSGADLSAADDYQARWKAGYTGGWDNTNETEDYFNKLLTEVREAAPFLKKPPLLVPVGNVMASVDLLMKAGKVPGHTGIYQFYRDGIHLNESGSYLVACTYFATLFRQSPAGLPTEPYGDIDPKIAKIIQDVAWDVAGK